MKYNIYREDPYEGSCSEYVETIDVNSEDEVFDYIDNLPDSKTTYYSWEEQ